MFAALPSLGSMPEPRDGFTRFAGGLDQETPAWSAMAGSVRLALNFEVATEQGYQDIAGYEAFDGQPAPSAATFMLLDVTVSGSVEVGDTVTGAVTGDTGVVIAIDTYPDDPTQTYLVLTKVVGDFDDDDEDLEVSASVEATCDEVGYTGSAPTAQRAAQYKNLAADEYRSDIAAVPGEGDVWGGFSLNGTKYAIRNHTGGATAKLFESSAAGWVEVDLGYELAFTSGGTTEIVEGDTITGLTSSETADVRRVVLTSGTWASGDAAGYLYLDTPSGAFQAENIGNDGASDHATIAGDATAITMQPDGQLDWDGSNFADTQGAQRVYGADGVNFGFEFDGTAFVWIRTGMTDDTPDHVRVHKNQLFFSFDGSVQHSGIGTPYIWSVVLGASEIATGFQITALHVEPGEAGNATLLIACRERFFTLYGNDSSDWNLVAYREEVGAYEWTLQQLAYTLYLDDHGISDLRTVQAFGNFDHSALSGLVRTLVNEKRSLAVASCVVRNKNQYRLFFSDESAIYVTMKGRNVLGMMPVQLEDQPVVVWSDEYQGTEEIYFGCDDGFVYQMERGTSFNGAAIYGYLFTHFDNQNFIQTLKQYYGPVTVEAKVDGYAEFDVGYSLSYGAASTRQPNNQATSVEGTLSATWDSGLYWDTGLQFDSVGSGVPTIGLDLEGEGQNISWGIIKNSDYTNPVLLTGVHYRYLPTVQIRG